MNRSVHAAVGVGRQGIRAAYQRFSDPRLRISGPKTADNGTVTIPFELAERSEGRWVVGTATVDMLAGAKPTAEDVVIEEYLTGHGVPPSRWD